MFAKAFFLGVNFIFCVVYGYNTGAPLEACESMTPVHFDELARKIHAVQSTVAPFTVKVKPIAGTVPEKLTYKPDDKFEVTIDGGSKHEIEGVFIQARRLDYRLNTIEPIGEFAATNKAMYRRRCIKPFGSGLTHREEVEAHKITMTWTAPSIAQGHLQIFVTIVERYDVIWVKIPSDKIIYDSSNTGIIPEKPKVDTKDVVITTDECGKTKGCFRLPTGCVNDQCEYIATYGPGTTADDIKIELTTKIDPVAKTAYVALGLSNDIRMGTDSVIQCMMFDGKFKIANSFNEGHNIPLSNAYAGLSNMKAWFKDGRLKCTFDRKKTITPPDEKLYSLDDDYYLFLARGPCSEDTLQLHGVGIGNVNYPKISDRKISLSTSLKDTNPIVTKNPTDGGSHITPAKDLVIDVSTCGTTKGCFLTPADCKFSDCEYVAAYAKSGENIAFEISAKIATSNTEPYVAIGFSGDQTMGDDSVIGCLYDKSNGKMKVFNSFNNGYTNAAIPEAATGLSAAEGAVTNGNRITCKFQRKMKIATGGRKRRAASSIFDLSQPWHVVIARGGQSAGGLTRHSTNKGELPVTSAQKVDLTKISVAKTPDTFSRKLFFKKFHAIIMIAAWVSLAGTGMIVARFFKHEWPGNNCCGEKNWFQIHRLCMILVFIFTIVGFVMIFVAKNGKLDIDDELPEKAHPIIGIVVTVLCVLNPIIALFRCHPGEKYRVVFKIIHWIVGLSAHILSMATIMIGIGFDDFATPGWTMWVMVGYIVFHWLMNIILDIHNCASAKRDKKRNKYMEDQLEMNEKEIDNSQTHLAQPQQPQKSDKFRLSALGIYVIVVGGAATCLIVLVAIG